eukprot:9546706-Ditylum_brightwellii.AAC.1
MKEEDLHIVESITYYKMTHLDYQLHLVMTADDQIDFTDYLVHDLNELNLQLIEKCTSLAVENPDDLKRRQVQSAVITEDVDCHYDKVFVKAEAIDQDL